MPSPGKQRALPAVPSAPAPACAPSRPGTAPGSELWLAIHLPNYILDASRSSAAAAGDVACGGHDAPDVVVDPGQGGRVVCACGARAAAAGIVAGMALNSACALLPDVRVLARDPGRERRLLESVAAGGFAFTPRVNLEPPDGVLLEVRGSLRLFGGVRRLCAGLRGQLQARRLEARIALTPTRLASLWFARSGIEVALRRQDALAGRLAALPLSCTRWSERSLQSLATMGVRTLGECLRLPRDGFARRFGPRMLLELDRALGRAPDPRPAFVPAGRFTARRDLEPELTDVDRLHRVLEPLIAELCAFLRQRDRGVETLEWRFVHRDAPATRLRLRFAEPLRQPERISAVLHERLARVALPAAVRQVRLRSGLLVQACEVPVDLFALERGRTAGVPQLVERLRARLGEDAVHGVRRVPGHRPEPETGDILHFEIGDILHFHRTGNGECPLFFRPLWLLAEPRLLEGGDRPCYQGVLEIEDDPERIESGWWDGRDVRRDYYVAHSPAGMRLWIFRERGANGRWFLHGAFG